MAKFDYKKWIIENKYGIAQNPVKKKIIRKKPQRLSENILDLRTQLTEDPSMWSAIGGIMGLLGSASIVASLQMMAEDPAMQEKYPKATEALNKIFGFLGKVGGDMASGMGKGVGKFREGKGEKGGMGYKEYLKKEIEGDKYEAKKADPKDDKLTIKRNTDGSMVDDDNLEEYKKAPNYAKDHYPKKPERTPYFDDEPQIGEYKDIEDYSKNRDPRKSRQAKIDKIGRPNPGGGTLGPHPI